METNTLLYFIFIFDLKFPSNNTKIFNMKTWIISNGDRECLGCRENVQSAVVRTGTSKHNLTVTYDWGNRLDPCLKKRALTLTPNNRICDLLACHMMVNRLFPITLQGSIFTLLHWGDLELAFKSITLSVTFELSGLFLRIVNNLGERFHESDWIVWLK